MPNLFHQRDLDRMANILSFEAEDACLDAYQATRIFYVTAMRRIYRDLYDSDPETKPQCGDPHAAIIGGS